MPAERIANVSQHGYMHPLVCWGPDERLHEVAEVGVSPPPVVRLFAQPARAGGIYFHPSDAELLGLNDGEAVGPVYAILDELGVDQMIRALRRAKRQTWPKGARGVPAGSLPGVR